MIDSIDISGKKTGEQVSIDVSASDPDDNLDTVYLNLTDGNGNIEVLRGEATSEDGGSFSYSYNINADPSNLGSWSLDLRAVDSLDASMSNSSTFSVGDGTNPSSQSLQNNVSGMAQPGSSVNLSAEFRDDDSGLSSAVLATNESGSWENKTSNYASPYSFNGETGSFELADFTWQNPEFTGTFGYRVWTQDQSGNWNKSSTDSITFNLAPVFNETSLNWTGIGDTFSERTVSYSVSDPDGLEIGSRNSPLNGTVSVFTNSSYEITELPGEFDYLASITDFTGVSTTYETNYTTSETGFRPHSFNHDLDEQRVNNTAMVENRGQNLSVDLSMTGPGTLVSSGSYSSTLQRDESVSLTGVFKHDFITGETETQFQLGQNTSKTSTVDTQFLYNQTGLRVYNDRNYSFPSVDLSSRCSLTETASVPSGSSQITSECGNESVSGDWVRNEENTSTEYVSGSVLLGDGLDNRFTTNQDVEVTNVRSSMDLTVDLDSLIEDVPGCQLGNSSTQSVPADSISQFTFAQSCSPGKHLNRTPVLKTETSSFYKYSIEFGFEAASNLTEEQDFEYAIKTDWADNWNSRDPTETEATIDGSGKDVQVEERVIDGTEYIVFVIGDEHGNSSIHKGKHTASLNYYESKSPGSTSGSSGSSGGSLIGGSGGGSETVVEEVSSDRFNWTFSTITSNGDQSFQISGYPGASFEKYVVLRNTGDSNVTLDVECASVGETCDWVDLSVDRVVLNRNSFSEKTVTVSGEVPEGFSEDAPIQFSIRASDPRFNGSDSGEGVAYVDFTVTNSPVLGPALDVALKVFEGHKLESPVSWGNPITIPFFLIPVFWASLVMVLWSLVEWLNPLRRDVGKSDWSTNLKWVTTVGVFLMTYIVL